MSTAAHQIRRQLWQVRVPDLATGLALRQQLAKGGTQAVEAALQAALDACGGQATELRIGCLRLHIRLNPAETSGDALAAISRQLPQQAQQALAQALIEAAPADVAERFVPGNVLNTRQPPSATGPSAATPAAVERLRGYLATGGLDWPEASLERDEVLARLRQQLIAHCHALADWLASTAIAATTLDAHQAIWSRLLPLLSTLAADDSARCLAALDSAFSTAAARALTAADGAIAAAASTLAQDAQRLSRWQALVAAPTIAAQYRALRTVLECYGVTADGAPLAAELARSGLPRPSSLGAAESTSARRPPWASQIAAALAAAQALPLAPAPRSEASAADGAALAVPQAGLLLLHPFLPTLFAATGISQHGQIAAAEAPRAAALLQFLATGEDAPWEFNAAMAKLLLGLPMTTALPLAHGQLSAADQQEAEALLAAVIGHWTALKRSGAGALRSGFLQRRGLLSATATGPLLRVQPSGVDALLARLPWSLAWLNLPWLPRPIAVDWQSP